MAATAVYAYPWQYQSGVKAPDVSTVLQDAPISAPVQRHLVKIYATLALSFLGFSAGEYLGTIFPVPGIVGYLGAVGLFLVLVAIRPSPNNWPLRLALVVGSIFSKGFSSRPLLCPTVHINPWVITALVAGGTSVFLSFAVAAAISRRRWVLYSLAVIFSAISVPLSIRCAAALLGPETLHFEKEVWAGLSVAVAFFVFETQLVIARALAGGCDFIWDGLQMLFEIYGLPLRVYFLLVPTNTLSKKKSVSSKDE